MKYRKRPVIVEAAQWFKNGDHPLDYAKDHRVADPSGVEPVTKVRTVTGRFRKAAQMEGDVVRYFRHPSMAGTDVCRDCGMIMHYHGWIDSVNTLNPSGCTVCPGDWIIPELSDPTKYYPCKPAIFDAAYEPVTDGN